MGQTLRDGMTPVDATILVQLTYDENFINNVRKWVAKSN